MQKSTLLFLFGMLFSSAFSQISPAEKEALKALYDATNGPNWISETDADPSNNWDFSGPVTADWFGIFMLDGRLETLRLYRNNLDGYIPESIGNLFNLKRLYLDSNNLSGPLPESLGNLTKLETLYASSNNLSGPIPQSMGRLNNIKGIQIEYNALEGPIPEKLGEAPNLSLLYLSSNRLSGPIPESLGYHIAELLLDNNQLTGSIPESFSRPGRPWFALAVNNNQLEGKIPDYFSRGNYHHLRFANNRFEFGGFEESFDDYKDNYYQFQYTPQAKVNEIESQNRVNGTATTMVTNCSGAQNRYQWFKDGVALMDEGTISGAQTDTLNIGEVGNGDNGVYHCEVTSAIVTGMTIERNAITLNVLEGPCEVTDRAALMAFYHATDGPNWINSTNWNTSAPMSTWYGVTTNSAGCVTVLDMNNTNTSTGSINLSGTLPQEIGNLRSLGILDLSKQNLTGSIPQTLGNLENLSFLDLSKNELGGEIPPTFGNLSKLEDLILEYNQLTGEIPDALGKLLRLESLLAQHNLLTGAIPNSLGNLTRIRAIWLNENRLTGPIPVTFGRLRNIEQILLNNNGLSGTLPNFWENLQNMEVLWLSGNEFSGTIPSSVSRIPRLEQLQLQENQLTGSIPPNLGNLSNLISLHLGDNPFTGPIPKELGNISSLENLTIYRTQVTGALPPELGNLKNLGVLWIAFNEMSGQIPSSYANLTNLRQLVLDDNELTGTIPTGFGQFTKLENLSVSDNHLDGTIPDFSEAPIDVLQFDNNRFQFGDFENQFQFYSNDLSLFYDNPQAKINELENNTTNIGDTITLTTIANGSQNHYQWFKDGIAIDDAPDSPNYTLTNIQIDDAGDYHCEVTSEIVTDLTLVRNDISLKVSCSSPVADNLEDIIICESYTLPVLSENNKYFTATHGGGTQLNPGDVITNSQTIYIYAGTKGCSDESSFTVTVESPVVVNTQGDVQVCENYMLPILDQGNYYTEHGGQGTELFSGDRITVSQTVYIYFESRSCSDESSFTVAIEPSICKEEPKDLCRMEFPKFFTPNNDGRNDFFEVMKNRCGQQGILNIYDRYGKLLFQGGLEITGWDGTYQGNNLPATDYWYRFTNTENKMPIIGHFTLKR